MLYLYREDLEQNAQIWEYYFSPTIKIRMEGRRDGVCVCGGGGVNKEKYGEREGEISVFTAGLKSCSHPF